LDQIEYNLKRVKKIFLFLNRKGFNTLATCKDCGYIAKCPTCNLPLTLHSNKKLTCHHCDHQNDLFLVCPKCKSTNIKLTGTGTEKIIQEIKKIYPLVKILKIDQETPCNNQNLDEFDIIIGTQYAFDYIDWQKINLIGVINADTLLHIPDFRSSEKTFNLLMKLIYFLSNEDNKIIIQTFSANNYIFKNIKKMDYKNFYINEILERKGFHYPPFSKLIKLIYQNIEFNTGQKEIENIYNQLISLGNKNIQINPPFLVHTQQVRGRWRWQIIIKVLDKNTDLTFLKKLPENIIIDVDPQNLL
jgi:primosomal protein N' (replication factor Y)